MISQPGKNDVADSCCLLTCALMLSVEELPADPFSTDVMEEVQDDDVDDFQEGFEDEIPVDDIIDDDDEF